MTNNMNCHPGYKWSPTLQTCVPEVGTATDILTNNPETATKKKGKFGEILGENADTIGVLIGGILGSAFGNKEPDPIPVVYGDNNSPTMPETDKKQNVWVIFGVTFMILIFVMLLIGFLVRRRN